MGINPIIASVSMPCYFCKATIHPGWQALRITWTPRGNVTTIGYFHESPCGRGWFTMLLKLIQEEGAS